MKASIAAAIIAIFGLVLLYYVDIRYFPVNAFWKAAVTGVLTAAIVTYPASCAEAFTIKHAYLYCQSGPHR